jgi:hypothetical protein
LSDEDGGSPKKDDSHPPDKPQNIPLPASLTGHHNYPTSLEASLLEDPLIGSWSTKDVGSPNIECPFWRVTKRLLDGSDGDESRASTDTEDQVKGRFGGSDIETHTDMDIQKVPLYGSDNEDARTSTGKEDDNTKSGMYSTSTDECNQQVGEVGRRLEPRGWNVGSQSTQEVTENNVATMKTGTGVVTPEAKAKMPSRKSKASRKVSKAQASPPRSRHDRKKPASIEPAISGRERPDLTAAKSSKPPKKKRPKRIRKIHKPEKIEFVQENTTDVLSQRGGRSNRNPGNINYLAARDRLCPQYRRQEADKHSIAVALVQEVRGWGGRFLTKDSSGWYEMHEEAVLIKAKQALREGNDPVEEGEE